MTALCPELCWHHQCVLLPAVRSAESQISGRRNKLTELWGYSDQRFILKKKKLFAVEMLYFVLLRAEQTRFLHSINVSGKSEIFP